MVPILLFLILLVIAWPVFAFLGGALFFAVGTNMHVIIPTFLVALILAMVLAAYGRKHNLKLGGRYGEPLDPTKPAGVPVDRSQVNEDFLASKMAESFKVPPEKT